MKIVRRAIKSRVRNFDDDDYYEVAPSYYIGSAYDLADADDKPKSMSTAAFRTMRKAAKSPIGFHIPVARRPS